MLILEIKRILHIKSTLIMTILVFLFSLGMPFLALIGTSVWQIDEDGNASLTSGPKAITIRREIEKIYYGPVTLEKLWEVTEQYQSVRAAYGENIPNDVYIKEIQPAESLMNLLSAAFSKPGAYGYDVLLDLSEEDIMNFYELRDKNVTEYLTAQLGHNTISFTNALQKAKQVEIPFNYFSYNGWPSAIENISAIIIITLFSVCIIAAPVFSSEYQSGSYMISRAAKNGGKKLARTKVLATTIVSLTIYLVSIFTYSSICFVFFGIDGLKTPIQFSSFLSPIPYTYGDILILTTVTGLMTVITANVFVCFLSSCFISSVFAAVIGISTIIVQQVLGSVSLTFVQFISDILPTSGTMIYGELYRINYFTIGPVAIWSPHLILLASTVAFPLYYVLTIRSYTCHKLG